MNISDRKLEFNSVGTCKDLTPYCKLTEERGLFKEAMKRNCWFHSIADVTDVTKSYLTYKVGWSCIFEYRLPYSTKTFPFFGTYVREDYRGHGLSSWLTMLTMDMAEEMDEEFVVVDSSIRYRMKSLCEGRKIKILPIWLNFYPELYFVSSLLTDDDLEFFAKPKMLSNLGIDIRTDPSMHKFEVMEMSELFLKKP